MFILENELVRRFRICVHLILLLMIPMHAAPQHRNIFMDMKQQLSAGMGEPLNPLIQYPRMKPNLNNLSYTGKPTEVIVSSSYSNLRASMKVTVYTQSPINDTFNSRVIFTSKPRKPIDSNNAPINVRSPIVNSPKMKRHQLIDAIIERCQKNATAGDFCEFSTDYPMSIVDAIWKNETNRKIFSPYFSNDTLISNDLLTKTEFEPVYRSLCPSRETLKQLSVVKNVNNEFKVIMQTSELQQTLRVETCTTPNSSCELIDSTTSGYKSRCEQSYVVRKLVTMTPDSNGDLKPILEDFQIPSCCKCKYINDPAFEIMRSSGLGMEQSTKRGKKQNR